ncbi:O-methyltransferase family 3 [Ancylobacter novellus DSM 506]|uniref:O-methyltransferase family 3 n=1 Tax=Ancylobacter novellus (strain ATCC 8093 / DSM 506 / JCM 20403 / CCM 1077 / IAM 12100 / NBRC 12443 / NCIMB 10456) TaxID=639283 RepID=D7A2G4_ANCN5|nr:O-methyltransferase [Ancylobacter novellus]ADH89627.1 O-methyltransferase family 3 [Ancylobacter novellus DSM 506]
MTDQQLWTAVDDYVVERLVPPDGALEAALTMSDAAGLPAINVAPNQGKLLMLLAKMAGARRILEIGTLGGYSTIWLARALPADGRLVTLEYEPDHAEVARANIARAGLGDIVDIRVGPALQSLAVLETEGEGPFDLVFIDADKPNNPHYLDWALKFSQPGTVIVADNVVRDGTILDPSHPDARVQGVRGTYDWFAREPRVTATAVQTVGSKGYDGFAVGLVTG